jgi:hypothetical protein
VQGPPGSTFGEDAAVFAGFTTTSVTGAVGSRERMHAACAADFANAHLCHVAEYGLATSATPIPNDGAWVDASAIVDAAFDGLVWVDGIATRDAGRYTGRGGAFVNEHDNCASWTTAGSELGLVLAETGSSIGTRGAACTSAHVLACCTTPYRERFRGFTSATTTGDAGGRSNMHARCGAELPGSHLCHTVEYERAASTITPPAGGAWVDPSGVVLGAGTRVLDDAATARAARITQAGSTCDNWTNADASLVGRAVRPDGTADASCATARPLACCD